MPKSNLTKDQISSLFEVDVLQGTLAWKSKVKASACKSGQAGCLFGSGYRVVRINRSNYFVHRLIWLFAHGQWPAGEIDHINGVKSDNRLVNLRDVTKQVNKQNIRRANANNPSGLLGAHRWKDRWSSHINVDGKSITLGYFDTPEDAHAAYVAAKRTHHLGNTL